MVKFGGPISSSKASLRVTGDTLIPAHITRLLNCAPTLAYSKGEIYQSAGRDLVRRGGMWSLKASESGPGDLNFQITEILSRLNPDPDVWAALARNYHLDIFCGLFLKSMNEGVVLPSETLSTLGKRGIELSLDIYAIGDEDDDTSPDDSSTAH